MSSKLCLEIPQPLFEALSGISRKLGRKPEELILKAVEHYVELASEIDRIYYTESFENCEDGREDVEEIGEEEKIEKLREVLGKYRSIGRWLK